MNQYLALSEQQIDYILLDGSWSMNDKWHDTLRAIDAYVQGLKEERINSRIYLHIFSGSSALDLCGFDGHVSEWTSCLNLAMPAGSTHLYDAVNLTGQRLRDWDPTKARVVIATDGEEAGSVFTDLVQAQAIIKWMKAKGWPVTFIGADFSNAELARSLGAEKQEAIGVQKALLSSAAKNLAKKSAAHARGASEGIGFSEEEQTQFGGYLAGPSSSK